MQKCQDFPRHPEQALSRELGQAVAVGLLTAVHGAVGSYWVPQGGYSCLSPSGTGAEGLCPRQPG